MLLNVTLPKQVDRTWNLDRRILHDGVLAVVITLFGTVRIRRQKTEDITTRGKFGQSGKCEVGIAQEVCTRNTEGEIDTATPKAWVEDRECDSPNQWTIFIGRSRNLLGEGEPHRTATIEPRIEPNRPVAPNVYRETNEWRDRRRMRIRTHEETLQQLGCIRSAWWSCVPKIRQ